MTKIEPPAGQIDDAPNNGPRHIRWNMRISAWLHETLLSSPFNIVVDKVLNLPPINAPSPDFYVVPKAIALEDLNRPEVSLLIDVADMSLSTDLGLKARISSGAGVREHWVVDCASRRVLVHRLTETSDYSVPAVIGAEETAEAHHIDGLRLRLADLEGLA